MAEPREASAEQIAAVYRKLAERHAARRETVDAQRLWRRIQLFRLPRLRRSPLQVWALASAAALVLSLGAAFAASRLTETTLSYELANVTRQEDMIRSGDRPGAVHFSDGSQVALEQHTALALSVVGSHNALARLARGKLRVRVAHSRDTDWRFLAGPYEVRVVGTAFDLGWDAATSRMTLVMHEGRVQVVGPADAVRSLAAGESLVLPREAPSEPTAEVRPVPALDEPAAPVVTRAVPEPRAGMSAAAPLRGPGWTKLVAKGRFDEVVQAADSAGIDSVLNQNTAADLKALAHAAHYTGRTGLALRTWTSLRQRFAELPVGRQAAFFLGRIHDQQGRPVEALRWIDRYLADGRDDTYASEALGRKLTLVRRLSGTTAAQKVAREYVKRFPTGSYVQTARDMLAQ